MHKFWTLVLACLPFIAVAQTGGYRVAVDIADFGEEQLLLGYYYGDKQYILDTARLDAGGQFVFSGEEALTPGVYLVVMPPENSFFQVLFPEDDQEFSLSTRAEDPSAAMQVTGSEENDLFYRYIHYLAQQGPKAEALREKQEEGNGDAAALQQQLDELNEEVAAYQQRIIDAHPGSMTAALIRANLPLDTPEFNGSEEEVQVKRWRYTQGHFFDNIELADPRMLRTPFLFERVNYFVQKLQVQHPDTIAQAIDYVLEKMKPAEETFRFYLIHFLNAYARSNVVGMDAVYVHLVDNYYSKGLAPWTEPEQLTKIVDNANSLRPILIGKIAPDIRLETPDGKATYLHQIESDLTVLYFWRYDCGHCKESTPIMEEFQEKYKDKGVKLVAVCVKFTDEVGQCWDYVKENEISDWMHFADPYHRSRYMEKYFIKSTPQIFILDKNKEILSKRIGAEQLSEVVDRILELKAKEAGNSQP